MINRSGGVFLLKISFWKIGRGSFGKEAVNFSKFLKEAGFSWWQTLPFGTTDKCNSPYKSFSAFAGNPLFIDLPSLAEKGLLTEEELKKSEYENPYFVDFEYINKNRYKTLYLAY